MLPTSHKGDGFWKNRSHKHILLYNLIDLLKLNGYIRKYERLFESYLIYFLPLSNAKIQPVLCIFYFLKEIVLKLNLSQNLLHKLKK